MGDAAVAVTMAPSPAFYVALAIYGVTSMLYVGAFFDTPKWLGVCARWGLILAFVAHGVDIGWRGVESAHPGSNVREALGFLSWVLVGGFIGVRQWQRGAKLSVLGAFIAPAALILLAAARLSPSGEPLPGLNLLGRVHISLATLGVAIFALATAVAAVYLLQERNLKRKKFDGALFKRGVALETLDSLAHRLILVGFPIFTVSLMLGVVWVSQRSSGFARPEYPIALITWGAFGGLLVLRTTRGLRGRRAALLTILGFVAAVGVLTIYLARRAWGV